jgi:spore coat polysaccharide biosynthesis protein SpsF (cytidylyltransferase family)
MGLGSKMNRVAIIQARTSSSRLPGKVLRTVCGDPMIVFMLRRVAMATSVDRVLVATSFEKSDDDLADIVQRHGYDCYRGDLVDVLARYANAAREFGADVVVRLTADCPLVDRDLIDRAITTLTAGDYDYVSNVDPPTFPDGLDVEAMTNRALQMAHDTALDASDREHVTPYIRRNKAVFRQATFHSCVDLSSLRWTVDHEDDLELVNSLIDSLQNEKASSADRFDFLRAMDRRALDLPANRHSRNETYIEPSEVPIDANKSRTKP